MGARLGKDAVVCYIGLVSDDEPPRKRSLKERLSAHVSKYGSIAIYTYFTLSILTIVAFSIAIGIGIGPSSASGVLGAIGAGWIAAKATMPLRILATLGLTPLVAALYHRRKARRAAAQPADESSDD